MSDNYHICTKCKKEKYWYLFRISEKKPVVCLACIEKEKRLLKLHEKIVVENRLNKLINRIMDNRMSDLRIELFETLRGVKSGQIKVPEARSICEIAQVIINSAKVEIDFMKTINAKQDSGFFQLKEAV